MNEHDPKDPPVVAWVSRHPPIPAQTDALKAALGSNVQIVEIKDTYTRYQSIIEAVTKVGAKHAVVVLPLTIIQRVVKSDAGKEIIWLRAEMKPAHHGVCTGSSDPSDPNGQYCRYYNKNTDVLMPSMKETRHLRFNKFERILSVDTVTTEFTGKEELICQQ